MHTHHTLAHTKPGQGRGQRQRLRSAHHGSSGSAKLEARFRPGAPYLLRLFCRWAGRCSPPGRLRGFFRGFLFCSHSLFLSLFSFSSVSQQTWALSFSTPQTAVGFYSVDPLQKPRSICLISWRSLDSSIACCLCSCINHRALTGNQGQNFCYLNTESHIQLYQQIFIASLVTSTSPKMEWLLMTCPLTKILEWDFPSVKTYWPLTLKGQIEHKKRDSNWEGRGREGAREERSINAQACGRSSNQLQGMALDPPLLLLSQLLWPAFAGNTSVSENIPLLETKRPVTFLPG